MQSQDMKQSQEWITRTSLLIQWLRLWASSAGGLGSIPGQGARSHMLQLRVHMLQLKLPHVATKAAKKEIVNWYLKIHLKIIHNSPKVEITRIPINE